MKEIAKRLHENKQIRLAKEILENAGYKVKREVEKEDTVNEAIGAEFMESVEEFRDCIKQAYDILGSTEEGVLESLTGDDELQNTLRAYLESLNTNIYLSKKASE